MTFLIISHVIHKINGDRFFAYAPYVREMNIWLKYAHKVIIVAPVDRSVTICPIELPYEHHNIEFIRIPNFNITRYEDVLRTFVYLPFITIRILRGMKTADHIHIRCPGNVGLIGCFVQILFPHKKKTAKYAGNWDWHSRQPWSYRLQQRILRNTFLTRNMIALVYGDWYDRTKNIKPFFTASYSEKEIIPAHKTALKDEVKLAFVGALIENKNPLACAEALEALTERGINASLTYCGDGPERHKIEEFIHYHWLHDKVKLLGNLDPESVKQILQQAHFLILLSRSEGWPKAVSEAMWWGCIPVTTPVSYIPQMLGNGERGELVNGIKEIADTIFGYLSDPGLFDLKSNRAMEWSQKYTTERFEQCIKEMIQK